MQKNFKKRFNNLSTKEQIDELCKSKNSELVKFYNLISDKYKNLLEYVETKKLITKKIQLLLEFAYLESEKSNYKQAVKFAKQALELAKNKDKREFIGISYQIIGMTLYSQHNKIEESIDYLKKSSQSFSEIGAKKRLAKVSLYIGINYRGLSQYNQAENYLSKSLAKAKEIDDKKQISDCYNEFGLVKLEQALYNEANKYFIKAIEIKEELNDKSLLHVLISNIGSINFILKNYDKALEYYFEALKSDTLKQHNLAYIQNNIGNIYYKKKEYQQALKYYKLSIQNKEEMNDEKGLSQTYNNIAAVYLEKDMYDKALTYCHKSIELKEKLGFSRGLANSLNTAAFAYLKLKKLEKAYNFMNKSYKISKDIDAKELLPDILKNFSYYFELKNNIEKALEYHKKYAKAQEEYIARRNSKEIQKLQMKHQSEKKEKEKEIYRLKNVELKKANAAKDKFFSIVAHDLKSPFSTFMSFVNLMRNYLNKYSTEKVLELVDELESNIKSTYKLLENLLNWSRLQSGVIKYTPGEFDIYEIVENVMNQKKNSAKQKKIKLINKVSKETKVYADMFMIETVIRNLITNALKFTNKNGSITVFADNYSKIVKISVADTGIGMTEAQIEKLFKIESTFSRRGTHNEKGSGLGLILCADFVKKNKGVISVQSEPQKGSTFSFTLPKVKK